MAREGWLGDLLGIKDTFASGVANARRSALDFIGFNMADNTSTGRTEIYPGARFTLPAPATPVHNLDHVGAMVVEIGGAGAKALTGLVAYKSLCFIVNVGAGNLTINHQNAGSTAANRFVSATAADLVLPQGGSAIASYDATASRWNVARLA